MAYQLMLTILASVLIICYYGSKLIDKYLSKKYRNVTAEFTSDIYRLQKKWSRRGCYDYSQALILLIDAFNPPAAKAQPLTEEGKRVIKHLDSINREEDEDN